MAINFAAASTAGLNNPGTEIITLVKDGGGNFINPPSYDKMRAYLQSGEVPMLFVTDEGGETGSLYQFVEYSETENKIRFSNDKTTIEFSAGSAAPVVSEVGGGGGVLIVNITNGQEGRLLVADITIAEIIAAAHTQLVFAQYSVPDTSGNGTPKILAGPLARMQTAQVDGVEKAAVFFAGYWYDSKEGSFVGGIMGMSENGVDTWRYYA